MKRREGRNVELRGCVCVDGGGGCVYGCFHADEESEFDESVDRSDGCAEIWIASLEYGGVGLVQTFWMTSVKLRKLEV